MPDQDKTRKPDTENATTAMHDQRFKVPGDVVNRATADLPDEQRSLIRWLHSHAAETNLSLKQVAERIRYDDSTLSRVFRGVYTGNLGDVCAAIARMKDLVEKRATIKRAPFVTTSVSRKIFRVCETAHTYQKVAFIYGESHIGKTTALEEYARTHNHGETVYTRMPTGGNLGHFIREIAKSLRISRELKEWQLRERIKGAFDDRMLFIVDQAHECFRTQFPTRATLALLFIMEIFDQAKCGVVIAGTKTLRDEFETGKASGILKQLSMRSIASLQLPDRPTRSNMAEFAAFYDLPPAEGEYLELQDSVLNTEALGKWCTILQAASRVAAKQNQKLTWAHVTRAYDGLKALSNLDNTRGN